MRHPELLALAADRPGPHLSAYLPAASDPREGLTERIARLWRHEQQSAERSDWFDRDTVEDFLARHRKTLNVARSDGVAVFLADGVTKVVGLTGPMRERVVGGSCFHLKPLVAALQADRPYHLLALSRRRAQLFHGSARGLVPVPRTDLPDGIDGTALAQEHAKSHTLHTVGRTHGGGVEAAFHGHSDAGSDREHDLERYLRRVEAVVSAALIHDPAPLVLAGVDEELGVYRRLNTYPHLLADGVTGSPDHSPSGQLHQAAWPLVAQTAPRPEQGKLRLYHELRGTGRTADDLAEVMPAAVGGQLGTLLVSAEVDVWGTFGRDDRRITVHTTREPGDDELTNLAAVHVLSHGGTVYAVSPDDLGGRPALALRRLPMDKHGKGGPS